MENSNYRSADYAKRKELDDRRRFINQTTGSSEASISTGKYNIGTLSFPENVNSDDFPHYVSFYINIRGKSKFNTENRFKEQAITRPPDAGLTPDEIGRAINITAAGAGAVLGVGAVKKFASLKSGQQVKKAGGTQQQVDLASKNAKTSGAAQTAGGIAGGAAGLGVSWLAQKAGPDILKPDQSYRISDVITLAVQEPPSVSYDAKYNDTALGTIFGALGKTAGALEQGRAAGLAAEAGVLGLSALAGAAIGAKLQGTLGGAIGGAMAAGGVTGAAAQAMTKMKTNPFREMLFEQIDYRAFKFNYRFLPKNQYEVDNIKRIIDMFKFHMHPELSTGNLFFIYPAEFQIVYFYKGQENTYFHKIAPSALTNLSVNYGGAGGMSSFHDGTPTEINMSLSFQEMELLTKEKVQLGY
jgi:hypothetical protein